MECAGLSLKAKAQNARLVTRKWRQTSQECARDLAKAGNINQIASGVIHTNTTLLLETQTLIRKPKNHAKGATKDMATVKVSRPTSCSRAINYAEPRATVKTGINCDIHYAKVK